MVVVKSDEKREYASVEFLKWFTDAQRNLQFSTESGYLPVKKEANSLKALEAAELNGVAEALAKTLTVALDAIPFIPIKHLKTEPTPGTCWNIA